MFHLRLHNLAKPFTSMLKTTPTQSTKNLPSDMAEDAEVGSQTSSMTRSAKNLSALVDMPEDAEVDKGDGSDKETVKKSPFFKKPNVSTGYFNSLCSKKR